MSTHATSLASRGEVTRRGFLLGFGLLGATVIVACSSGGASQPAAGSAPASSAGAAPKEATVKLTDDNKFVPASLTVAKGATVTFDNSSTMVHSVTDDPSKAANKADAQLPDGAQPWDSGLLQAGQKWTHTFDVAGTYKYFCIPHEALGMLGTITVQ